MIALILLLVLPAAGPAPLPTDVSTPTSSIELHINDMKENQFMNNMFQSLKNLHSKLSKIMPAENLENLKCDFVTTKYNDSGLSSFKFKDLRGKIYPSSMPMYSDNKEGNIGPRKHIEIHFVDNDRSNNSRRVMIQFPNYSIRSPEETYSELINKENINKPLLQHENATNYAENRKTYENIFSKNNPSLSKTGKKSNESTDKYFHNESNEENTKVLDIISRIHKYKHQSEEELKDNDNQSPSSLPMTTSNIDNANLFISTTYSDTEFLPETTIFPTNALMSLNNTNNLRVNRISTNASLSNSEVNQSIINSQNLLRSTSTTVLENLELVANTKNPRFSTSYFILTTEPMSDESSGFSDTSSPSTVPSKQDNTLYDNNSYHNYSDLSNLTKFSELSFITTSTTESMLPSEMFTVVNITELIKTNTNIDTQRNWTIPLYPTSKSTMEANIDTRSTYLFLTTEEKELNQTQKIDSSDRFQIDHSTININHDSVSEKMSFNVDEKNMSNNETTTVPSFSNTQSRPFDTEENIFSYSSISEDQFNYTKSLNDIKSSSITKYPESRKTDEFTTKNYTFIGNMLYLNKNYKNQVHEYEGTTKPSINISPVVNEKRSSFEANLTTTDFVTESIKFKTDITLNTYENLEGSSDSSFDINTESRFTTENVPHFSDVTNANELLTVSSFKNLKSESLLTTQTIVNTINYNNYTTNFNDLTLSKTSETIEYKTNKNLSVFSLLDISKHSTVPTTSDKITSTTIETTENFAATSSSKSLEFLPTEEPNSGEVNVQYTTYNTSPRETATELGLFTDISEPPEKKRTQTSHLNDHNDYEYSTLTSPEHLTNTNISNTTITDRERKSMAINITNETISATDFDKSKIVNPSDPQTGITPKNMNEVEIESTTYISHGESGTPEIITDSTDYETSSVKTSFIDEYNGSSTVFKYFIKNKTNNYPEEMDKTNTMANVTEYYKPSPYDQTSATDTLEINTTDSYFQSISDQNTKELKEFNITTVSTERNYMDTSQNLFIDNKYTTTEISMIQLETTYMELNESTTEKRGIYLIKDPKDHEFTTVGSASQEDKTTKILNYNRLKTTINTVDTSSNLNLINNKSLEKSTRAPRLLPTKETNRELKKTMSVNFSEINEATPSSIFNISSDKIISNNNNTSATVIYNNLNGKIDSQQNNYTSKLISSNVLNTTPHYLGDSDFNNFTFYLPTTDHRTIFVPLQISVKSFKPLI